MSTKSPKIGNWPIASPEEKEKFRSNSARKQKARAAKGRRLIEGQKFNRDLLKEAQKLRIKYSDLLDRLAGT